ncbi:hypothetical protein C8D88_105398 [Lentzea atacamensis]|uniref:Uncharacterized protein n=1 Tax=Lentzea atacamensis TaxID=531938 RepID=A0A316I7E9_9PSEU|nr:hypothetical protein C8D88_105398 [Lentzea atacamensis]
MVVAVELTAAMPPPSEPVLPKTGIGLPETPVVVSVPRRPL